MFTNRILKATSSVLVTCLLMIGALTCRGNAAPRSRSVPFKGQSGGFVSTVGFDPLAGIIYTHAEGSGNATHIGAFTAVGDTAIALADGTVWGSWVLTAADGDMLFLTMEGGGVDPTHGSGIFTIVGGTGRFDGATGSYDQAIAFAAPGGSADVIPYTEVFEGTIARLH